MIKYPIWTKRLNKITTAEFYEKDIAVRQENDYVVIEKAEILELAETIKQKTFKNTGEKK